MTKIWIVTRYANTIDETRKITEQKAFSEEGKAIACQLHMIDVRGFNPAHIHVKELTLDNYEFFNV